MKNLNKVLKLISDLQDDVQFVKTEKHRDLIESTNMYSHKREEKISYTLVLKFNDNN